MMLQYDTLLIFPLIRWIDTKTKMLMQQKSVVSIASASQCTTIYWDKHCADLICVFKVKVQLSSTLTTKVEIGNIKVNKVILVRHLL